MTGLIAEGMDFADVATYGYRTDRWNFVEGEALAGIVAKLNKEQNRYVISSTNSRVVWRTLLFYPGATLVRVTDLSWRPHGLSLYFIGLRGQYRRLDGARRFIHFLNEKIPLKLTAQNVIDYLRFYCFFVRWQSRPFLLVEQIDDLGSFSPPLDPSLVAQIQPHLKSVTILKEDSEAGFEIAATVRYSTSLFDCVFAVNPKGHVRMLSETEIPVELPVASDIAVAKAWAA